MKTHAGELELPQTLSECHVCIQQLMADLAESQARVAEWARKASRLRRTTI